LGNFFCSLILKFGSPCWLARNCDICNYVASSPNPLKAIKIQF
jgi:hypothetical protein